MKRHMHGRRSAGPLSGRGLCWGVLLSVTTNSLTLSAQEPSLIDIPRPSAMLEDRQFSRIRGIRELADGRLLVSDPIERSFYVVDFPSQTVNTIGTTGDGPNEYREPGHLYALGNDSTLLTDETTHRVFLVVGESIVRTLAATSLAPLVARGAPEGYWGADRFGRILVAEGFAYGPRVIPMSRVFADSVRFLLTESIFADEEVELRTIAEVGGQGRLGVERNRQRGGLLYHTSPLAAEGQAWLFQDGWIAVAYPEPYRVDWRSPEGRWVRGPALPFTPVEVNRQEKCFALVRHRRSRDGGCLPDASPGWPDYIPPFLMEVPWVAPGGIALGAAPDGTLLIHRTRTAEASENRYDVVNRRGELKAVIRLPADQTIVGFGLSSLYVVHEDDAGLLTLSRHPWP